MVLKPKQDTVTSILFAISILFVAVTGAMAVMLLSSSGSSWSNVTMSRVSADEAAAPSAGIHAQIYNGFNDCEVVYQQGSLGSTQLAGSSAAEPDIMGELYYAVYICTGVSLTTGSYI
jgi:hypothetical protein